MRGGDGFSTLEDSRDREHDPHDDQSDDETEQARKCCVDDPHHDWTDRLDRVGRGVQQGVGGLPEGQREVFDHEMTADPEHRHRPDDADDAEHRRHRSHNRNIVSAALEIAPDATMQAIAKEVIGFEMPGATMAGFRRSSMMIAKAGIYDLRLHYDDVIMPVLRHWRVLDRTDFGPEGEQAREQLAAFLQGLDEQATKFVDRREENRARVAARDDGVQPDIVVP